MTRFIGKLEAVGKDYWLLTGVKTVVDYRLYKERCWVRRKELIPHYVKHIDPGSLVEFTADEYTYSTKTNPEPKKALGKVRNVKPI